MKKNRISILALLVVFAIFACVVTYALTHNSRGTSEDKDRAVSTMFYDDLEMTVTPADMPSRIKDYVGFKVSFNKSTRVPNWVGWELLRSETDGAISRSNKFWEDEQVEGCASLQDYRGSGYDRGHMCPAADQKWSAKAMADCFVLTNMAPQAHALNGGAWKTLEEKERLWAQRDSAIVIVAGPVYTSDSPETIGAGVRVPDAFYKVLLAPYVEKPRAIGFIYPNMSAPGNMQNYVVTVDEVERITGMDFFSALPDSIEEKVESVASFKEWNKR